MKTILNWHGDAIEVASSRGGVLAVVNYKDNLIMPERIPWPPPEIVQKLYQSYQSRAFEGDELDAVTRSLGYYSDLQSLHSEDAVTWSAFGTLKYSPLPLQYCFLDELFALIRIPVPKTERVIIDIWRRIPHPETLVPGGPEIDAVLQTENAIIFCEAKWLSKVSGKQGKSRDKDQIKIREEFLLHYGRRIFGSDKQLILLFVSPHGGLIEDGDNHGFSMRDITWESIVSIKSHPYRDELFKYLKWKEGNSKTGSIIIENQRNSAGDKSG